MDAGCAGGRVLRIDFFGGLWWTVRKGVSSSRPALWFLGSVLARMTIALTGFYYLGRDDWRRLVAGLLGFVIARFVVIRLTRPHAGKSSDGTEEVSHAP